VDLEIAGQTLTRVGSDHAVSLHTDSGAQIRIEAAFELDSEGTATSGAPEELEDAWLALQSLRRQQISSATAAESGALRVTFSGGAELHVPPDDALEAWTFAGAAGDLVVCLPGGGLATWPARK
jgi:hypothetical protein